MRRSQFRLAAVALPLLALSAQRMLAAVRGAGDPPPQTASVAGDSRMRSQRTARLAPRSDSAGTLLLRNATWDSVRVEVRAGTAADCDAMSPSAGATRLLRRGRTWTIVTDKAVCWRRESDPAAPTGAWTTWTRRALAPGQEVADEL
jgi:hypothetical protein